MENLDLFQPRKFVPDNLNCEDFQDISKVYSELLKFEVANKTDLENWLLFRSELESAIDQTRSVLHIKMTCDTKNEEYAKAYQDFIVNTFPGIKKLSKQLDEKYLDCADKFFSEEERYKLLTKNKKLEIELFRDENIDLQTKESLLSQDYQKVCGAMSVDFEGSERTLPMMSKFLTETDRLVREDAWNKIASRRLADKEQLDNIFDDMRKVRVEIAKNAGFSNYVEYQFKNFHRFDYTPKDCKQFHDSIFKFVVPLYREILLKRKKVMGLDILKPWDLHVDSEGKSPLKPFKLADELIDKVGSIFSTMDKDLGGFFAENQKLGLLDLDSRIGKAPGGYQSTLSESRKPFIFMNSVGLDSDVRTLLHESGHAFHVELAAGESLLDYREPPIEFCEVASMSMELFGSSYLDSFYNEEEQARSIIKHLEDVIFILPWVATIDSFQHWIYENPEHSIDERKTVWSNIYKKYNTDVIDWEGFDDELAYLWHRQLHIFEYPFYYIEYAIAQLGALQLWIKFKEDKESALSFYKQALSLGGAKSLPELFESAGIKFDFSKNTIQPLMVEVQRELDRINR